MLFASRKRHSYRELPLLRVAEFSRLHRNERSGTLTGLSRVRSFAQDDAHIFCEPDQVENEIHRFFEMTRRGLRQLLGLEPAWTWPSRDAPRESFIGEISDWDRRPSGSSWPRRSSGPATTASIKPGEAAFYGPKIECDFEDVLGRSWTLGTLQIDMAMPGRFGLRYVGRDGEMHQPAMLHRAVLGSLERFIALYIEHTPGATSRSGSRPCRWRAAADHRSPRSSTRRCATRAAGAGRACGPAWTSAARSWASRSARRRSRRFR